MSARYVYAGIFLLASIFAWVERENLISGCEGDRDCLATEGVLIISLALFLFFSIMFLSTVGTRTMQDRRNSWQFQWWWLKPLLLLVCLVISVVFIPSYVIQLYGKAARFGAGVFLLIQLISVIRCITRLSNKWCQTNIENHYLKVIVISVVAYSVSIGGIIFMFVWYTGCLVNITFIVTTLVLFRNVVQTENGVPYGYGIFHFVYAMGSMYFGMVFVGWDTHHMLEKWSMDVSWTSTWVHIGNKHLAVMPFVVVVIARGYEIGWLQQLLGKIFGTGGEQQENNVDDHHTEPEGSAVDNGSPRRSRATDPKGSETDNGPPQGSHVIDLERAEMEDNGPPPSSSSTFAELLRIPLSPLSAVDSDSDAIVEVK